MGAAMGPWSPSAQGVAFAPTTSRFRSEDELRDYMIEASNLAKILGFPISARGPAIDKWFVTVVLLHEVV